MLHVDQIYRNTNEKQLFQKIELFFCKSNQQSVDESGLRFGKSANGRQAESRVQELADGEDLNSKISFSAPLQFSTRLELGCPLFLASASKFSQAKAR